VNFVFKYGVQISILTVCCFYLTSCNYTKHLAQNQTLLHENKIVLKTDKPIKYKGETESVILSLITPKANTHVFDLSFLPKFKLWKYNHKFQYYEKTPNDTKIIKHKVERPAVLDSNQVKHSVLFVKQYMENLGYFYAKVDYEITPHSKQSADVSYKIDAGKRYLIRNVNIISENERLGTIIKDHATESLLVKGDPYTRINCGLERDRLYKIIRNEGYFDFKSDNINFTIDTSDKAKIKSLLNDPFANITTYRATSDHTTIDVNLKVAKSRDSTYGQIYKIHKVKVFINSQTLPETKSLESHVNELDDIEFHYKDLPVNRNVISRNIFIHKDDLYNSHDYEITINRLNQLGVFQIVNIQYEKVADSNGLLNCIITVSMSPKLDLAGIVDVSTSDADYLLGTGVGLTFRNKNLAHGANLLSMRVSYSTEFNNHINNSGHKALYQSGNNFNLTNNLTFPKFIVPFNQNIFDKKNMPYTILGANYNFIRRLKNYSIVNISGSFGYTWRETQQKNWKFNPIFLTVTQVPEKYLSDEFKAKRETNSYLKNTFSNKVIQGENMLFEYRSKTKNTFSNFTTMKLGLEEAGTLLVGINSLYTRFTHDTIRAIAHFAKADFDIRRYLNRRKSQWVNRMYLGVGVPIGQSKTLPYIEQFSAGGAFSNRGWKSRNLGPGHSADNNFNSGIVALDKTGDLKLEANTEFRFNMLKLFAGAINLKGAAFIDAGNIWLMNKDSSIVGGEFNPNYFWQDIAIGSGMGLRLDFSFFVFRIDLGFPIKQPQNLTNHGFSIDHLKFSDGTWNLALGYPF
jgi:outer membrane protein assembly factor BamA